MTSEADPSAAASAALEELRSLVGELARIDAAVAAAQWDDGSALAAVVAGARSQLIAAEAAVIGDIGVAGASPHWRARAHDYLRGVADIGAASASVSADADALVAVGLARVAVAEAILAVAEANRLTADTAVRPAGRRDVFGGVGTALRDLGARIRDEVRHVWADKPRSILIRLVITLAVSLSLVAFYEISGFADYDAPRLTLYLFSAVVGSVVCTNALCFEAERVRSALATGERLWRLLVSKNLAMAALVTAAGLPVVVLLAVAGFGNPAALVDQLITMVFIWLGVGNVLSVVYPIRHEPLSARFGDGTWLPYLFSFAISYGVGLTVNLMIYWRLWARQTAAAEMKGGTWAAFAMVLASAVILWLLLTVLAVACSREPRLRRVLSREMVVYRKARSAD
ncbi:ABC transporter permease [Mycolicibacterium komossense]|uniref:ABC transporter permease n=1 Tax=Mycolicibacterium komossense TaxID=1779 RepID=A0ABT3C4V6_9MYCO|nr:ABC transporter permease [Mycolicibacterium komossense]MCV7224494.1 ABC transporter permease [Mycolicibacterium komossense]